MSISILGPPARRFLLERLDRLRGSLEGLGHRLRECIAEIVGNQMGEAIRDALAAVFNGRPSRMPTRYSASDRRRDDPRGQWYAGDDDEPNDPYWDQFDERDAEPPPARLAEASRETKPSRWRSVLASLAQMAGWWLQRGEKRPSWRKFLGLGAVVGVVTLIAGPIVGSIALMFSTALLLTSNTAVVSQT